jgi:uncharacterized protein YbjT (DUF2867 family)
MPILVLAATGRVGRLVVAGLRSAGFEVRCLVRNIAQARKILGEQVQLIECDLSNRESLSLAMSGVNALFISSAVAPEMSDLQINAVEIAATHDIRRVVKLSGSAWTMIAGSMTQVGAAHARIERALQDQRIAATIVRPNAFAQGMLGRIPGQLRAADDFTLVSDTAKVGYIDIRDIAAFCVRALVSSQVAAGTYEITGPSAWSGAELAGELSVLLGRPIRCQNRSIDDGIAAARVAGEHEFVLAHQREVLGLIAAGAADRVTDSFHDVLRRAPRSPLEFLQENLRTDQR